MGGIAHHDAVVMHAQVGVVVFAMGDPGQRIHKGQGAVIVGEAERARERHAGLGQLPAGHLRQQLGQARLAQLVVAAFAREAVGLLQGNQIGHDGLAGVADGAPTRITVFHERGRFGR